MVALPFGGATTLRWHVITIRRDEALEYHARKRPGKVEVVPTKPVTSQRDLSLAYTPGVAEPCRVIAEDRETVALYTRVETWLRW